MNKQAIFAVGAVVLAVACVGAVAWRSLGSDRGEATRVQGARVAAVEVSAVEIGDIEADRVLSGTLASPVIFDIAPKVAGRVVELKVNVGDRVSRGQVVALLDDDESRLSVAQANADLRVAEANLAEARSTIEIAERSSERVRTLRQRGVASESQLDAIEADMLAKRSAEAVAEARVERARAEVAAAKVRLGYTRVTADWAGGDDERVVSERYVDAGVTLSANTSLMTIVELDPLHAVAFVTERDYGRLAIGQPASVTTDAYGDEVFIGEITRIAPVFSEASRQARVEVTVANESMRLKPGMFARIVVVVDRVEGVTIVPAAALTRRDGMAGVFVLNEDGESVAWRPVRPGLENGGRLEVEGPGVTGQVVTLGQQLIEDDSLVRASSRGQGP